MSLRNLLAEEGKRVVDDIRRSVAEKNVNATGNLSRSLLFEATPDRLTVSAAGYVFTTEEGRGPSRGGTEPGELRRQIEVWLAAKNIPLWEGYTRKGQAFVIARKIHNEGTRLFRRGGNSGALSSVLNDELIEQITAKIADQYEQDVLTAVARAIQDS